MFDVSARLQLPSAGEARAIDQKKLKLILDNVLPLISVGLSTYAKAIRAWPNEMCGFEKLATMDAIAGVRQCYPPGTLCLAMVIICY